MVKGLFRFSLLLLLISAVGLVGLNRGLDPRNVRVIQAHAIIISMTSSGPGNTVGFVVEATCSSVAMAPGDVCDAAVGVENTGEGAYRLSAPTLDVSGPLTSCGGGFFNVQITNLTYTPDSTVIALGDTHSFHVVATLDIAAPNECQDQQADILITLEATATEDHTPTPTATNTPDDAVDNSTPPPTATSTPVNQVGGTQATPTNTPARPTPVATLTSEVLPSRFPSTGQGVLEDGSDGFLKTIFFGIALIGAGFFILALRVRANERDQR